jgi:undecaprenyl diphosphate synthase
MDGNGRWAKKNNVATIAGHKAGASAARAVTKAAAAKGVEFLTLYAFSSENWRRNESWLTEFFGLLTWYLENEVEALHKNNVRIKAIGDRQLLPKKIQTLLTTAEAKTQNNTKITVTLALSYSGRNEIVRAVNQIIQGAKDGSIDQITEESFASFLDTNGVPDPDLLIRTSGEQRISNYMLWQLAYTEFVFDDILWPDFTAEHFEKALYAYTNRERRYGKDNVSD